MSERVVLPTQQPPILGYAHHAFPLSIPWDNQPLFAAWNATQWIQLCCPQDLPENRDTHFDFFWKRYYHGYDWLESRKILKESVSDVVTFAKESLDEGFYVVLYVDEFYIPKRVAFQKSHNHHEVLIFGYEAATQTFDIRGYNQREIFAESKVTFDELRDAFSLMMGEEDYMRKLYLLRPKARNKYKLNILSITESLNDFLKSNNTFEREMGEQLHLLLQLEDPGYREGAQALIGKRDYVFGLNVYDSLLQYVELLQAQQTTFDIRPLHILYEHKKCMQFRMEYFAKEMDRDSWYDLAKSYAEVVKKAEAVWKHMIKFNMTKRSDSLQHIREALPVIREIEVELLTQFYEELMETTAVV